MRGEDWGTGIASDGGGHTNHRTTGSRERITMGGGVGVACATSRVGNKGGGR